ncbi:hypothetical protein GOQ29_05645 [Clostridium sp. D2Q-14]|uniref:hypothetical protein n=1 Tax=Anaeromonas gelatinilytica TaxID=2683194 RepID=UPI00193BC89B|nr:hypothetical protein [Anaeromonas gelatinilytica]MBS4535101.1 hypothetical protein [Anaeromonas gelatinilytica]
MNRIFFTIVGAYLILYGFILFTRRKIMEKNEYGSIFVLIISIIPFVIDYFEKDYEQVDLLGMIIVVILPITIISIILNRERYNIINVNSQMIKTTIIDLLRENDISYEEEKNAIILKDHDNKRISYKERFNSVDLKLTDIRQLTFYKELKTELKYRIKEIDRSVFPFSGIFYIIFGILIVVVI